MVLWILEIHFFKRFLWLFFDYLCIINAKLAYLCSILDQYNESRCIEAYSYHSLDCPTCTNLCVVNFQWCTYIYSLNCSIWITGRIVFYYYIVYSSPHFVDTCIPLCFPPLTICGSSFRKVGDVCMIFCITLSRGRVLIHQICYHFSTFCTRIDGRKGCGYLFK